jgi:hypothetical protein
MALGGEGESNQSDQTLTGVYNHDKAMIRDIVTHALQSEGSILPAMRLKVIINYIAEVVTSAADKLEKIQRFAVLLPVATGESRLTRDCKSYTYHPCLVSAFSNLLRDFVQL